MQVECSKNYWWNRGSYALIHGSLLYQKDKEVGTQQNSIVSLLTYAEQASIQFDNFTMSIWKISNVSH